MENVVLGRSVKLTVSFYAFSDVDDQGALVDPIEVTGNIRDHAGVDILDFTPDRDSVGMYSYVWTPDAVGQYTVTFIGKYANDGSIEDITTEEFNVAQTAEFIPFANKLGEDQYLQFMSTLDHLYIDPEEIQSVFPDAPIIDIAELIRNYSIEVQEIMGPQKSDPAGWETVNFEYIRAATLCALSKFYGFGDADLTQITLGDLEVTNQRFGRTTINRANAVTWCEIAGALRMELIADSGRANFKQIKKGAAYGNPIPHRKIRSVERGLGR